MKELDAVYLGDAVYASCDGCHIVLSTSDGYGPTNIIYLEDTVAGALMDYINKCLGLEVE